mgnify:CR=1 FL=1
MGTYSVEWTGNTDQQMSCGTRQLSELVVKLYVAYIYAHD